MNQKICERYREALGALREDREVDGELEAHLTLCSSCSEALELSGWLRSAQKPPTRPLPTASQLWWKAQIIRSLTEKESMAVKATRPVRWTQGVVLGLFGLTSLFLLAWMSSSVLGGLDLASSSSSWLELPSRTGLYALVLLGTLLPLLGFAAVWALWRDA